MWATEEARRSGASPRPRGRLPAGVHLDSPVYRLDELQSAELGRAYKEALWVAIAVGGRDTPSDLELGQRNPPARTRHYSGRGDCGLSDPQGKSRRLPETSDSLTDSASRTAEETA